MMMNRKPPGNTQRLFIGIKLNKAEVSPKAWFVLTDLHSAMSQKTGIYISNAVATSLTV
jgi:hypothetical protein